VKGAFVTDPSEVGENNLLELRRHLEALPSGPVEPPDQIESLLAACWRELAGGSEGGMAGSKLHGRMEEVTWQPPVLAFSIERHGATVLGSSRAELHHWSVNVEQGTAVKAASSGYRQLVPREKPLDVGALVGELVKLIRNRRRDARLDWGSDGAVKVLVGKIIPAYSAAQQTVIGRRKRFRAALLAGLEAEGWLLVKHPYTFARKA
jgi:hypothetical protein